MSTEAPKGIALLEKALHKALKEVSGDNPETGKPYTLTDRCKVWDRVLKLEAINAKLNAGNWGAGFEED